MGVIFLINKSSQRKTHVETVFLLKNDFSNECQIVLSFGFYRFPDIVN